MVSDHYLKNYSSNFIQTWCVHLLGKCSESVFFLATLAKFWPSSGHTMTENGGFRPLSEKVFTQSNSNLVGTFIGWVFRIDLLYGHVVGISPIWWPQNDWKIWFPTIIWKTIYAIQFKISVYTYWVSVQKWFAFWSCWPDFGPVLVTKWLRMMVSDHYMKNHSRNPIQTLWVHILGEYSEIICFLVMLARFWPCIGHKMTENDGFIPLSEKKYSSNPMQTWCVHLFW